MKGFRTSARIHAFAAIAPPPMSMNVVRALVCILKHYRHTGKSVCRARLVAQLCAVGSGSQPQVELRRRATLCTVLVQGASLSLWHELLDGDVVWMLTQFHGPLNLKIGPCCKHQVFEIACQQAGSPLLPRGMLWQQTINCCIPLWTLVGELGGHMDKLFHQNGTTVRKELELHVCNFAANLANLYTHCAMKHFEHWSVQWRKSLYWTTTFHLITHDDNVEGFWKLQRKTPPSLVIPLFIHECCITTVHWIIMCHSMFASDKIWRSRCALSPSVIPHSCFWLQLGLIQISFLVVIVSFTQLRKEPDNSPES